MASISMTSPTATLARPPSSTGATTSSYSVSYEKFAPRSTAQVSRLNRIAALTVGPIARSSSSSTSSTSGGGTSNEGGSDGPTIAASANGNNSYHTQQSQNQLMMAVAPPILENDDIESFIASQPEEDPVRQVLARALEASDRLTQQLKHTTSLRLALRASINIAEDISNRHADLIRHSGELSAAADRLQEEETMLTRHAEEIGMPLQHYDAVDRIGVLVGILFKGRMNVRGLAKIKVDNDDYPGILDDIDKAVDYFGRESGGKEALQEELKRRRSTSDGAAQLLSGNVEYYRRALALQDAALDLIKEAVAERISNTTSQIVSALNIPKVPVMANQLEASLIYTRFHGIASRSNRLLALVRARLNRGDAYRELLAHCRNTYCSSREILLRSTVEAHMEKLKQQHGSVGMTRLASVFLIRLCTVETALYLDFFGEKKSTDEHPNAATRPSSKTLGSQVMTDDGTFYDSEFQTYLASLCGALHRTVRRSLVTMLDLDTLCQIVSVLREERSMASASPTTMAASRAISSVIEDAQERLIFCANSTLTKQVVRFKPTPADLDYPDKLTKKDKPQEASEKVAPTTASGAAKNDEDSMETQLQQAYESWFPPMRTILKILSKIFRVVEPKVFEDIALHSVQACTQCLRNGASYIQQRKGIMHSDLFLVKHLLILREQLSPFDIELRSVERQLDFSDAGKAVARFLANRNRQLFSMSTENALVSLLREGVSVQESSVDSKRDLEDALRSACNDFIDHTCKAVAGDLLSLIEKLRTSDTSTLARQALLQPDSVLSILEKTAVGLEASLVNVTSQMSLYLDNPATQNILLKPVNRKITRTVEELRKMLEKMQQQEDDAIWDPTTIAAVAERMNAVEQITKRVTKVAR